MKSLIAFITLGTLLGAPLALNAKITRLVEKDFTVQSGGTLKVQTSGGDINVVTGTDGEVKVVAKETIKADSEAHADEVLRDLVLTIEQQGNNVTATAKYNKSGLNWGATPVTVGFTVIVPRSYNVDLNTSGGDIEVASLNGKAKLRTSGGDIKLQRIDGEVDGSTSGGDVKLLEGTARVKLSTSGGNIHVDRAEVES